MSTPHNATAFPPPVGLRSLPGETRDAHLAAVNAARDAYNDSFDSASRQYAERTGQGEAELGQSGYPGTSAPITEIKKWVAGTDDVTGWVDEALLTGSLTLGEMGRAVYAYEAELTGQNRSSLLGWLENLPDFPYGE